MASHNQATSGTTPLLGGFRPANSTSSKESDFSPETLLIPVVLATRLGSVIPSTTLFELTRQTVCRLSNSLHDRPSSFMHHGPPHSQCGTSEVVRDFATVTAIFGVIGGLTTLIGCGILNRVLPHCGRKPAFLFLLIAEITWSCLIPASQLVPHGLSEWIFLIGMLLHVLSSALPHGYLVDMYIVDVAHPEERTATMSKIGGWGALGVCIPLVLGGSITTRTGNPFIVFYISVFIFMLTFIYIRFVLPETFPEERRKEIRLRHGGSIDETTTPARLVYPLLIFKPLQTLVPVPELDGTRNWRLTWCALHALLYVTANAYALSAWLVLATSKYNLTPADTGVFFTIVTSTGMIVLSVVLPRLVRFLRPYYTRTTARLPLAEGGLNSAPSAPETSDRLDAHVAFGALVLSAIAVLCTALSTAKLGIILSAILIGLTSMHHPTSRSLVVGSVGPQKQGDALAAMEMVISAGKVLSPIIMGSIFTATIDTTPLLVFYVHLVVVLVGASLLLLVRDADRFHKSDDA